MAKANPLQEQLLKAGLVKKSKVAEVAREQLKARHGKRPADPNDIRRDAERSAGQEFLRLQARLEAEVVERAIDAAEQAIREKLTPADQRRLVGDYLTRLEEVTRS